ncbi:YcaO-like family protein [Streptomyces sp. ST2-7A]|uniref:YcaO-like family protein n=1 Tax=Streptomyces sp. ST2-7A TaxID=2907214 RepID=UPI001F28648D|nr:YcaO-like family protein [Streptomyces sp. ST2-7A]MCE7083418.1 YcaO-like family protein [Streptomyces sp. ST2-7A]
MTLPAPADTTDPGTSGAPGLPSPTGDPAPAPLPWETLVDPVCGIVRSVAPVPHPEDTPTRYTAMTAEVSDARHLGDWPADRVSLGTTFGDPDGARLAAVAEAVERYCGNRLPPPGRPDTPVRATADELLARGENIQGPTDLPTHAAWQLETPGFPYRPLTGDTPALWAWGGEHLPDGSTVPCLVPVSLSHLNWRRRSLRDLPRTHHLNYAGIATGEGIDDARERGLLEVVERDALELWWHLDTPARGIDPASVPGLTEDLAGTDLEVSLVEMPSEFAPCVAAHVHDPARGLHAAGFACRWDPAEAARKAVLEAVHTRVFTLGLIDADGWVFRAVEAGLLARGLYLDHREDRRYLDAAGPRCEAVRDLGAHVQVWLDPRTHPLAERFTRPALGTVPVDRIEAGSPARLEAALRAGGHRVFSVDLTTEDIAETPWRVVRVLVSGLVPNAPAAFSYLGCPRFAERRPRDGGKGRGPGPEDLTLLPPPHM